MHTRLAAATALAVAAIVVRGHFGAPWPWLAMNLVLAWIPVFLGLAARRRRWLPVAFPAWLVFLPNAPYLVTDLIHLAPRKHVPLWYDASLLGGVAALGLALGAVSLADVAASVERHVGRPWSYAVWLGTPWLAGLAIYLGRYARWNSWDLLTHPAGLASDVARLAATASAHDRAFVVTHGALFAAAALVVGRRTATDLKPRFSTQAAAPVLGSAHDRSGREGR
jgi:uncharacterized membrane protein